MTASSAMRAAASARISAGRMLRRNLLSSTSSASPHNRKQTAVFGAMRLGVGYCSSLCRNSQRSGPLSQPTA